MQPIMARIMPQRLDALTPDWIVAVLIAFALIGGLLGGLLGKRILKKHFEKAGITA